MDNSPKIEKYPDIEYVLHIYDTIWDYYLNFAKKLH